MPSGEIVPGPRRRPYRWQTCTAKAREWSSWDRRASQHGDQGRDTRRHDRRSTMDARARGRARPAPGRPPQRRSNRAHGRGFDLVRPSLGGRANLGRQRPGERNGCSGEGGRERQQQPGGHVSRELDRAAGAGCARPSSTSCRLPCRRLSPGTSGSQVRASRDAVMPRAVDARKRQCPVIIAPTVTQPTNTDHVLSRTVMRALLRARGGRRRASASATATAATS